MIKPGLDRLDAVSQHPARAVNNLYFEKPENAHFIGRSGSEPDLIPAKTEPLTPVDDHFPFVDSCLPHVKAFSYVWFHLQAAKRQYFKKCERKMPLEEELKLKNKLQSEIQETKQRWATRLLAKLRKDIDAGDREKLAHCLSDSARQSSASTSEGRTLPCVLSIADLKGKMRRIDCLRQADKVWRLDIVLAVLFRAVPLESTDGERVEKSLSCRQPLLCVNPYHLNVGVRELDMFLSNYLFNFEIPVSFLNAPKANQAQFVAVSDGVYSRCVFGARELLELSKLPINSETPPCPGNAPMVESANSTIATASKSHQQQGGKPQSAFKPLVAGSSGTGRLGNPNEMDHLDCDKDGASDEEVASLVGLPAGQYNIAGHQRIGPVRQQQAVNASGRHQQQQNCFTSPSAYPNNSSNTNRVVVVPSHGLSPASTSAQHSFQPIRTSPPISMSSVSSFVKQEIPDDAEKVNAWGTQQPPAVAGSASYEAGYPGNSSQQQNTRQNIPKPVEVGADRLEDFANYVVEAASRSNSPVRKQPRLSLEGMVSNSSDFDLAASNGQSGHTAGSSQLQSQPVLSGLNSPSLMMHAGMMMINGMQAASTSAAPSTSVAPPPPPTHPLLYSPNPFSLFSSPAITPRTTPRSTPVPNAQSTFAAAVAAAAAQMGAESSNETNDRDRQLQLAAGLFEQNLRVFGLLGAVSGGSGNSGSTLFRNPGLGGLGGLASGLGSALMSGADTGNAGQTTPTRQGSPLASETAVRGDTTAVNHDDSTPTSTRPSGTFEPIWNSGVETPQIGSGGQPNSSSSCSGDEAFVLSQTSQRPADEAAAKESGKCKPNLLLVSTNVAEEKA